MIAGLSTNQR